MSRDAQMWKLYVLFVSIISFNIFQFVWSPLCLIVKPIIHTHSLLSVCVSHRFRLALPVCLPSIKSHHAPNVFESQRFAGEICCYSTAFELSTGPIIFSLTFYQVYSRTLSSQCLCDGSNDSSLIQLALSFTLYSVFYHDEHVSYSVFSPPSNLCLVLYF